MFLAFSRFGWGVGPVGAFRRFRWLSAVIASVGVFRPPLSGFVLLIEVVVGAVAAKLAAVDFGPLVAQVLVVLAAEMELVAVGVAGLHVDVDVRMFRVLVDSGDGSGVRELAVEVLVRHFAGAIGFDLFLEGEDHAIVRPLLAIAALGFGKLLVLLKARVGFEVLALLVVALASWA